LASGAAAERFGRMVAALGGPADFIEHIDGHLRAAPIVRDVLAGEGGVVSTIDTRGVGMAVVALGGGRATPADRIDHAVGFDRLAGLGLAVTPSTPIARLHAHDEASAAEAERRLRAAYAFGGSASSHPLIADRLTPELMA